MLGDLETKLSEVFLFLSGQTFTYGVFICNPSVQSHLPCFLEEANLQTENLHRNRL